MTDVFLWDESYDPRDVVLRTSAAVAVATTGGRRRPVEPVLRIEVPTPPPPLRHTTTSRIRVRSSHTARIGVSATSALTVATASHTRLVLTGPPVQLHIDISSRQEIRDNPDDLLILLFAAVA